ncbi:MAG: DUF4377 domain-containing protein [Candidatus Spechtbacteria bacterium SB0662_bin_43]|uniref:DUF4377 domain-containing protein n=1 Tax=Candidatus Spechtbacteria bacterium SB0662_bin_43 TaxID=2604897 RepID=A0A845D977_9BACT|nr:DUF4377 domain-containing protein [Candidatus Spechtbacteria bacterium SB0662_bin_43]
MQLFLGKKYGVALLGVFVCAVVLLVLSAAYRTTNDSTTEVTIAPVKVPCTGDFLKECFVIDNVVQDYRIDNFAFQEGYTYVVSLQERERGDGFVVRNVISRQAASREERNAVLRQFGRLSERELMLLNVLPPESQIGPEITDTDDTSLVLPDVTPPSTSDSHTVPRNDQSQHVIVQELHVAPYFVSCGAGYANECLSVDGEVFYGDITGFDYEEGYEYMVRVEREPLPATGVYSYTLVEILSKEFVDSLVL